MGDQFSYDKVPGHKFGIKQSKLECILKKKLGIFSSIFKSVKSPVSSNEIVQFPDSPDFEILPDFWSRRDVQ